MSKGAKGCLIAAIVVLFFVVMNVLAALNFVLPKIAPVFVGPMVK